MSKVIRKKNIAEVPPVLDEKKTIIAIGASAGGLEALQEFIGHLPELSNFCIIIAQHLSPTHKSMLVELLRRETKREIEEATNGMKLATNRIYITPPDNEITIHDGIIRLQKPTLPYGPKPSVDLLFQSLATNTDYRIIGIILSGTGSDGAAGVRQLKNSGAYIIAQDPETAKYDGMPSSAIQTGLVDAILPPDRMGDEILDVMLGKTARNLEDPQPDQALPTLEKILFYLGKRSGADFSNYKKATICRRLEKRMEALHLTSIDDYLKLMEQNPREADEMFKMVLIGVTMFFRDMESFGVLEDYLRRLLADKTNTDPIRIWVPGCSTGEEAYSIAILITRILKEKTPHFNVQIFATDIDQEAINIARKGIYEEQTLGNMPQELIDQYFVRNGKNYELIKKIRSMVLFSRHDVIRNPPFLKLDLISCRNLLIYFNSALQQQIIPIFHYALNPDALLFLGKSETVGQFGDLFHAADNRHKIFLRKRGGSLHAIKFSAFKAQQMPVTRNVGLTAPQRRTDLSISELVKESLFTTFEHPYVVVNESMDVQEVNGDVRLYMTLSPGSISLQLIKMLNPELQIEVRSILTKSIKERTSVRSKIKKFEIFDNRYFVRINAKPLLYTGGAPELFVVIFERLDLDEMLPQDFSSDSLNNDNIRVAELEHELVATKEHLQTYIEEIETSNEELQSLNEELQSTNEELQSSNEELETSNEELQSTNEEIQIAYAELKTAHDELERKEKNLMISQANTDALLSNSLMAVLLVDNNYRIVKFNRKAADLFVQLRQKKLHPDDLIIDLVPTGHVEDFIQDFNRAMEGEDVHVDKKYLNAQGQEQWFSMQLSPVTWEHGQTGGISLAVMETTELHQAIARISKAERFITEIFDQLPVGVGILQSNGTLAEVNQHFCDLFELSKENLIGKSLFVQAAKQGPTPSEETGCEFQLVTCRIEQRPEQPLWICVLKLSETEEGPHNQSLICLLSPQQNLHMRHGWADWMAHLGGIAFLYERKIDGTDSFEYMLGDAESLTGFRAEAYLKNAHCFWDNLTETDRNRVLKSIQPNEINQENNTVFSFSFKLPNGQTTSLQAKGTSKTDEEGVLRWRAVISRDNS